jgi:hypothetical protein
MLPIAIMKRNHFNKQKQRLMGISTFSVVIGVVNSIYNSKCMLNGNQKMSRETKEGRILHWISEEGAWRRGHRQEAQRNQRGHSALAICHEDCSLQTRASTLISFRSLLLSLNKSLSGAKGSSSKKIIKKIPLKWTTSR